MLTLPAWAFICPYLGYTKSALIGTLLCPCMMLVTAPSPLLLPIIPQSVGTLYTGTILGAFFGSATMAAGPRVVVTVAERAGLSKEDVAGVYSSINSFFGDMTSMTGPIFGGFLVEQFGFPWATTVLGFISLAIAGPSGIVLWWRYTEPPDKPWPCFEQAEAAENLPGLEEAPAPSPAGAPAMSGVRWPTGAPAGEGEKEQ